MSNSKIYQVIVVKHFTFLKSYMEHFNGFHDEFCYLQRINWVENVMVIILFVLTKQ